ncbi:MAG: arylamine N-acetyltransferase, partial [Syntrophomonadaceae bacterium]
MISADEILAALDLSRAEPGAGFLEALFARFIAKVPFENASKILRDREVADPREKPREPETFWRDHLALGTGGTCFARVVAFDWLLGTLGFRSRRLLGRVACDDDHASLIVETAAGERIVDVGFPLPA